MIGLVRGKAEQNRKRKKEEKEKLTEKKDYETKLTTDGMIDKTFILVFLLYTLDHLANSLYFRGKVHVVCTILCDFCGLRITDTYT